MFTVGASVISYKKMHAEYVCCRSKFDLFRLSTDLYILLIDSIRFDFC